MSAPARGSSGPSPDPFDAWFERLDERAFRDLRFPEVRRALQALSSLYVERRDRLAVGKALDGAGKRAAFSVFYGPIHFLTVRAIARSLLAERTGPHERLVDLGCGTGVAGAAWALAERERFGPPGPALAGIDESGFAVGEATWTYASLGVPGRARKGSMEQAPLPGRGGLTLAAWALNELEPDRREVLIACLLDDVARGGDLVVVEPLARGATPFWGELATAAAARGGRADEWKFRVRLPERLRLLDRAAGLDHSTLGARSISIPGAPAPAG